ncbi:receptor-type tyrosine-protein phosphatase S isoform X3 [Rhinopithecus roxellana]|uniref:Receptor-type tyrosine-protein phosphatase S n=1 Tax=Macaca mulatta TaxID=9544 RepID=H9FXV1_MACMU|nr:PREDICTED: receptor-type tyrosine-protein phosphatase S isoform X4 [Rhinopithecus bieti]XP_024649514.1 receptor-type tyrosine-protein phosphatase S isoform X1 [Macaca nemestrina]XP_028695363.1 receptor-type tyrosine-protein phosphatase S isoform X10 [Macaca mulatta]XP_030792530.1 receptor-type tyrosine-protein phosphatase S isoform X3 [Rhinopithecus roxellana]XP_037850322.1 receptor-type tyrosine-protein phosphatase S isoform X12 [Chlorocebus sabaeus]XP_045236395.1 receptor-type tyrosine-pr
MAPTWGPGMVSVVGPMGLLVVLLVGGCAAEEPPRFIKEPKDQIGVSGGVASFVCQATGDPKPRVTWNKKGKKVNSQRFETIEFDESAGAVLRIQPLRTPRDENVYECVAQNSVGEITVHAKLTVLREDQLPSGFPNIDMGPQLKVVERTRTATMLCAASGNPDPEITWFKDFLPVDPSASNGRIKQLRSGALQIESSEETDQGKYECVATNSAGVRYSSPANLYVRVRRVAPRFSILPVSHEIMPGGNVNITCVAVGSPMPYVKWMQGAEDLTPEDDMPVGRNVLELTDVKDSANYTCVAMSSLGVIEAVAQITVKSLPKAPGTPVVTENTATSITITWDSGNPDPVSYYVIEYKSKSQDGPYQIKEDITTTRYSIGGLSPNSEYEIWVSAVNSIGQGPPSESVVTRTGEQAPASAPRNVQARMLSATTMIVQWEEPVEPNGLIRGYRVYYTMEPEHPVGNWQKHNVDDSLLTTVGSLLEDETYTVRVLAFTSVGDGPLSDPIQVKTQQGVPGQPMNLRAEARSETSITLSWSPPRQESIIKYELLFREGDHGREVGRTFDPTTSYVVEDLKPNTEYAFRLAARSPQGLGAFTPVVRQRTLQSISPKNFKVKMIMKTSVLLSWEFPDNYNSPTPYKIQYNGLTLDVDGRTTKKLITHLKPHTFYNFVLTNRGSSLGGLQQTVTAWTAFNLLNGKPSVAPKPDADGFIMVYLPDGQSPVPVQSYFIVMVPLRKSRGGQFLTPLGSPEDMDLEELIQDISRLQRRSLRHSRQLEVPRPYIAARFSVLPPTFHPGDQKQYGGFDNRGLEPGHRYVLFVLAVLQKSEPTFAASPFSDPFQLDNPDPQPIVDGEEGLIWVIGPVLAVVFIICIVIAILLYKNKPDSKRKDSEPRTKCLLNNADLAPHHPKDPVEMRRINFQTPDSGLRSPLREPGFHFESMLSHPPIPIADMAEHTERLKANDSLKLSQEYESIDPGQQFTWEHSNLEVNKPKNRYANVIAYDHSRVILQPIEGIVGSDYINANYVDGYRRQNAYIATQGPLPETFGDFWRMVWEQRSATIVMMTRLEEKSRIKCDQYWPNRGTETYGFIQVTLLDTIELATFCVRTFSLHKNGSSEKREVRQFQFTAWPDHGVPEYPTPFLAFLRRVKTCNPPDAGPIVVHCSAGVGRTGCFIVIDAMLERIKPEKTVDVYGHVTLMRSQRNYMVQTEDQYSFIHEALLEAVGCGNTEVPARSLYAYIQKLAQVEPGEHVTGMELEFKRLANSKAHTSRFISANLPCNKFKNRLVNIMPYESTRVCLQPIRGVEGSDYINASFIDGYRQQKAYIATQGPLAETTEDFWRMLWENNSTIVVMLTKLREMGREKCHQYWPAERSARYQYFVVDPMAEYNMPQYILREFKVTDARDGQSRTVRQFQFTDWPEQGVPKSGEGFIDFIGQVHKTKEQFGQDGPISVHCSAGVGRTGVFITLSIVLERMRYEGVVDIFQTVKMLRTQRPAMVQTEDEYQFCYQAALEYLGSFDHYAT